MAVAEMAGGATESVEGLLAYLCFRYGAHRSPDLDVPALRSAVRQSRGVVLVEQGVYSGDYWLSHHPTAEAAAQYHDGHQYPEDWPVVEAIDLATGARLEAQQRTALVQRA